MILVATTINGQPIAETSTEGAIISTTKVEVTPHDSNEEPGVDYKTIGYYILYFLISIPIAFTIFGLGYMIRTNCKIREKCCKCCSDLDMEIPLEKEDRDLDYGTYYDTDGERIQDVMEVQDSNPAYESANTESNTGSAAIDRNPRSDQQDDYDYMGNHDDYDYMG